MNASVQSAFDYGSLERSDAEFLREKTGEIRELARTTIAGIVRLGGFLAEVRDRLLYGQFEAWLTAEFNWSRRTAYNLINVHEAFGRANFAQLTIDVSALYLLAAPSTPEPVRQSVIERAQNGERISHAAAKEAIAAAFQSATGADLPINVADKLDKKIQRYIEKVEAQQQQEAANAAVYNKHIENLKDPEYRARIEANKERLKNDPSGQITEDESTWLGRLRWALELKEYSVSVERARILVRFSKLDFSEIEKLSDYLNEVAT